MVSDKSQLDRTVYDQTSCDQNYLWSDSNALESGYDQN